MTLQAGLEGSLGGITLVLDVDTGGGGGTPASPSSSIQYNNAGSFGGSTNATLDANGNVYFAGVLDVLTNAASGQLGTFANFGDSSYMANIQNELLVVASQDTGDFQNLAHFDALAQNARSGFILSNSGDGNWTENFVQMMVHGSTFTGFYYPTFTTNTDDSLKTILIAQSNANALKEFIIGSNCNIPISIFANSLIAGTFNYDGALGMNFPANVNIVGDLFGLDATFSKFLSPLTTAPSNPQGYNEGGCDSCIPMGATWETRIYSYMTVGGARVYSTTYLDYNQGAGPYTTTGSVSLSLAWDADTNPLVEGYVAVTSLTGTGGAGDGMGFVNLTDLGNVTSWNTDSPTWNNGGGYPDPLTPNSVGANTWINRFNTTDEAFYGLETDGIIKAGGIKFISGFFPVSAGGTGATTPGSNGQIPYYDSALGTYNYGTPFSDGNGIGAGNFSISGTQIGLAEGNATDMGVLTTIGGIYGITWNANDGMGVHLTPTTTGWSYPVTVGYAFSRPGIGTEKTAANTAGSSFSVSGGSSGTGTNLSGGDVFINGGTGTGSGAANNIIFSTSTVGASGTTPQTITERARITTTSLILADAINVVVGTSTGTKIGTSTSQKIGFFNAAPVIQQTGDIAAALLNLGLVTSGTLPASSLTGIKFITDGSVSTTGTATTTFTVTIGSTQANNTYKINVTPTSLVAAAVFYVTNKTTTTFDVVYLAGLTGAVSFDWTLFT